MNHDWLGNLAGRFLVFDGPDGSGKTTQIMRILNAAREANIEVLEVREPGGTAIGEQIRNVLLDPNNTEMSLRAEMMLYMASRSQLIEEKVRPALAAGKLVLADRFISSTLAYQGTAGGLPQEDIFTVGRVALGDIWPDVTVIFDVDEQTAASRLNPLLDRMEAKGAAFHKRVRDGYLQQAQARPSEYVVIDSTADEETVYGRLVAALQKKFPQPAHSNANESS